MCKIKENLKIIAIIISAMAWIGAIAFIFAMFLAELVVGISFIWNPNVNVNHLEKREIQKYIRPTKSREAVKKQVKIITDKELKIITIRENLKKYNSPMVANAEDFINIAYKYNLDWRLLPAIAIAESGGGKHCFKPYNAFGYGNYSFRSFSEAINKVGYGLSLYYKDGCKSIDCINQRYAMGSKAWRKNVLAVMTDLDDELVYWKAYYEKLGYKILKK